MHTCRNFTDMNRNASDMKHQKFCVMLHKRVSFLLIYTKIHAGGSYHWSTKLIHILYCWRSDSQMTNISLSGLVIHDIMISQHTSNSHVLITGTIMNESKPYVTAIHKKLLLYCDLGNLTEFLFNVAIACQSIIAIFAAYLSESDEIFCHVVVAVLSVLIIMSVSRAAHVTLLIHRKHTQCHLGC